jgi:Carboxypeptidase regulatory-like domain
MTVTPPKSWGGIAGTVSGEDCTQVTAPLQAVVYADGKGMKGYQFTLKTDPSGNYAFWGPAGASPWSLQASAAGWMPVTQTVSIRGGKTTTANFTLRPTSC